MSVSKKQHFGRIPRRSAASFGTFLQKDCSDYTHFQKEEHKMGRGLLLWLFGVPLPIVILLCLFWR